MTLLDQLQSDRIQLTAILKAHCEEVVTPSHPNKAIQTIHEVYTETLEDALKTLNSLVEYLQKFG